MQIYCEKPTIIRNPELRELLIHWRAYKTPFDTVYLDDSAVDALRYDKDRIKWFNPFRKDCNKDNIEQYVVFNPKTGETAPMYLLVPCGKCRLCCDKKAREWAFRAACENWSSTSHPLFVTLTYDNDHLPLHGVFKEEVQLFLKRLRINMTRRGVKHDLRYFAVAEYGTKSKRPHYHLIIWNFPTDSYYYPTLASRLEEVEKAWNKGFAYVAYVQKGAINYVMKYMRKSLVLPFGMNPVFFLSSRRHGGIGAAYARYMRTWYLQNPDCLEMSVYDCYSNKTTTCTIPQYFRTIFYPSHSKYIEKEISDAYYEFERRINDRFALGYTEGLGDNRKLSSVEISIFKKFGKVFGVHLVKDLVFTYQNVGRDSFEAMQKSIDNELAICSLCDILLAYEINSEIDVVDKCKQIRQDKLTAEFVNSRPLDIDEIAWQLSWRMNQAVNREKI